MRNGRSLGFVWVRPWRLQKAVVSGRRVQPGLFDPSDDEEMYTIEGDVLRLPDGTVVRGSKDKEPAPPRQTSHSHKYPPGSRWITVHPHGDDSKGIPVLIMPNSDGSATVIGGAGGKLNYLHLSRLRSPAEWQEAAKRRRQAKKEQEAQQSEEEKAAAAHHQQQQQTFKQQNALETLRLLESHGIAHGLSAAHLAALEGAPLPPDQDRQKLANEAVRQAKQIQQAYEHKLITDHEARAAAFLGDDPLGDIGNALIENRPHVAIDAEGNTLSSLQPLGDGRWLVRSPDPDAPDQVFSRWEEAAKAHVAVVQAAEQGDRSQPDSFYNPKQWVRTPPEAQLPEGFTFKTEIAAQIAKLAMARKQVEKGKVMATTPPWAAGFDVSVQELTDQQVLEQLDAAAETLSHALNNNEFLRLADGLDAQRLGEQVKIGGFAQLSELASDLLKTEGLPRPLVLALGHNEAAKVLAYRLRQAKPPETVQRIREQLEVMHAKNSVAETRAVQERVRPQLALLKQINDRLAELAALENPTTEELLEINNLSLDAQELQAAIEKDVGLALGRYQAEAALIAALQGEANTLRFVGDGQIQSLADLVPTIWGKDEDVADTGDRDLFGEYNLAPEDFRLEEWDGRRVVTILPSGVAKLAEVINLENADLYEQTQAIKRGAQDDPHWLPAGFAYRPLATFGDAQDLATDFEIRPAITPELGDDGILRALAAYAGQRVAIGDNPLQVRQDLLSPDLYLNVLGLDEQTAARALTIANQLDQQVVSSVRASDRAVIEGYRALAAEVTSDRPHGENLQTQTLVPEIAVEAAHRTLASMPLIRAALKPMDQLTRKERQFLREYAVTEILGESLERKTRVREPEEEDPVIQVDLFGNPSPAESQREAAAPEFDQWQKFSRLMGGDRRAYETVRDVLQGQFLEKFAAAYRAIAGVPLLVGQQPYANVERLLLAQLSPEQREEMLSWLRSRTQSDYARVRSRTQGRFATELDGEWLDRYLAIKGDNRQLSLLSSQSQQAPTTVRWQRPTLGDRAQAQLAQLLPTVLQSFEQIQAPVNLYPDEDWGANTANVAKQRAIKLLKRRKRMGFHFGAGSGKTSLMLGAFTELHHAGQVKRAIIAVPSAILGQFAGEMATFLEPGRYRTAVNLNWSPEQRLAALKDPNLHIYVTTRDSLTRDLQDLVQRHLQISAEDFAVASEMERREWVKEALQKEGIDPSGFLFAVDEAHDIARRRGVTPSTRSLVLDALAYHTPYYIHSTGTPFKNDLSEIFDFLQKVDPERFQDRAAFMAQYGANTRATRRSLQRLLAPYTYTVALRPTVKDAAGDRRVLKMQRQQPQLPISALQAQQRQFILRNYNTIREFYSRRMGEIMAELRLGQRLSGPRPEDFADAWDDPAVRQAIEAIAPPSWQQKSPAEKQAAIGGQVMGCAMLRRTALWRLYHLAPYEHNPKAQWAVQTAKDLVAQGRPCVIFTASQEAAKMLHQQLQREGLRVGLITGEGTAEQRERERFAFSPSQGIAPETDVLVCTDAAQTGLNLQRGKDLIHYDIPLTQKAWDQRSARIYRRGQTTDVTVHTPMLDTPEERVELARLRRKAEEGELFQQRSELLDDTWVAGAIERNRLGVAA